MSTIRAGHFGRRIRALREERGLSQEELADVFGFNDRQTVSAVETGARRLTAEELLLVMNGLNVPLDYFTDPFRLVGEGPFHWREDGIPARERNDYEERAGSWIAAFRELSVPEDGPRLLRRALPLDRTSTYEDAASAGERFVVEFGLGEVPANRLAQEMEQRLGVLVLFVDGPDRMSGAACRLPEVDSVLISRSEVPGRRNFDLAHELFHLLTWDAMPPADCSHSARGFAARRLERLADNFASAVLMPRAELGSHGSWRQHTESALIERLNSTADRLRVTARALGWRLVNMGALSKEALLGLPSSALQNNGRDSSRELESAPPPLYSRRFVEVIGRAIDEGRLSALRASEMLDRTIDDLPDLFTDHGITCPLEV